MRSMIASITLAVMIVPGGAPADDTISQRYVGGPGPYTYMNICSLNGTVPLNEGNVCFDRPPSGTVTSITVRIVDDSGLPAAGRYVFVDANRRWTFGPRICGIATIATPPADWQRLEVHLAGVLEAQNWCGLDRAGPAIAGEVQATFRTG